MSVEFIHNTGCLWLTGLHVFPDFSLKLHLAVSSVYLVQKWARNC